MEAIDWTKLLVPRMVPNKNLTGETDPRFTTTDLVTIPSVADLQDSKGFLRIKSATDFAKRYCWTRQLVDDVYHNVYQGVYRLRDPEQATDGIDLSHKRILNTEIGLVPCFSLQLPEGYTMAQLTEQMGLTQHTDGQGESFYQVSLGEYPRSKVTNLMSTDLNLHYSSLKDSKNFYCTGRLFTSVMIDPDDQSQTTSRQYPEYSYAGRKYARVPKLFGTADWYEVEPLHFWVKNYAEVVSGKAKQLDLEAAEIPLAGMPFHLNYADANATLWQNALPRAFLNSADVRALDGHAASRMDGPQWDFTQGGFLQQALNLTREPVREYIVPAHEKKIENYAFAGCRGLKKVVIPPHVRSVGTGVFDECSKIQIWFGLSDSDLEFFMGLYLGCQINYVYVPKTTDGKWLVLAPQLDHSLNKDYYCMPTDGNQYRKWFNHNYRNNFIQLSQWKAEHKIKFLPPQYVMEIFPSSEMQNFFVNNNHKRWAELIQRLHFDLLGPIEKANALPDLMKIYYALGGFAEHQGARDQAFNYVIQHVAKLEIEVEQTPEMLRMVNMMTELPSKLAEMTVSKGLTPKLDQDEFSPAKTRAQWLGNEIHELFSRLVLKGPYNPTFAQFFMKYYHENHKFMCLELPNQREQDYLCLAHNHFDQILENYPNRVVNGNTERDLLTPEFVAEHCVVSTYENVDAENQDLAELVGKYGYNQEQFGRMQQIFNTAKTVKNRAVIRADQATAVKGISFRVLEKDDPLGFVIGDITNCCQHIGGAGADCVSDGYINPHAGFLVFETDDKRILGQAYVWYDPETYAVCYDNLEIPTKVLTELKNGEKHHANLSMSNLLQAVIRSADAIMTTMNRNGTKVERVTMGEGYNDLNSVLRKYYPIIKDLFAYHRDYYGYTDADVQYLIRTYDQVKTKLTTMTANTSTNLLKGTTKQDDDNTLVL